MKRKKKKKKEGKDKLFMQNTRLREPTTSRLYYFSLPCLECCNNCLYVNELIPQSYGFFHPPIPCPLPSFALPILLYVVNANKQSFSVRSYPVLLRPSPAIESNKESDSHRSPSSSTFPRSSYSHTDIQVSDLICEVKEIKKARFVIWTIRTWLIGWIRVTYYSLFIEIVLFPSTPSPLLCPNTASTSIERKVLQKSSYEKFSWENTFTRTPAP